MRIFQNSVSFERLLAVSLPRKRVRFLGTRFLRSARSARNVRKFKVAFPKVIRLLKKPHPTFGKASDESGSSGKQF
jgi:hypothetical protein